MKILHFILHWHTIVQILFAMIMWSALCEIHYIKYSLIQTFWNWFFYTPKRICTHFSYEWNSRYLELDQRSMCILFLLSLQFMWWTITNFKQQQQNWSKIMNGKTHTLCIQCVPTHTHFCKYFILFRILPELSRWKPNKCTFLFRQTTHMYCNLSIFVVVVVSFVFNILVRIERVAIQNACACDKWRDLMTLSFVTGMTQLTLSNTCMESGQSINVIRGVYHTI